MQNSTLLPAMASSPSSTPYPTLYKLYANAGFSPDLVLGLAPMWLIASLGVFFNASLVYVTFKQRLRNWCNLLIALDCAYCAVSELSVTVTFGVVLSGRNWIPLNVCYWLMAIPNLGYVLSYGGMLAIAVERLSATLFLISDGKEHFFLFIVIGANWLMGVYYGCLNFISGMSNLDNWNSLVTCNTGDLFLPESSYLLFNNISLGIVALTAICYVAIWLIIRHSRENNRAVNDLSYTRRIYRSLLAIMVIIVFSHFASAIWRLTKAPGGVIPALSSFYQEKLFYCLTYFANTANAPVLYLMSSDYNKAFKSLRPNPFWLLDQIFGRKLIAASDKTTSNAKLPAQTVAMARTNQTMRHIHISTVQALARNNN